MIEQYKNYYRIKLPAVKYFYNKKDTPLQRLIFWAFRKLQKQFKVKLKLQLYNPSSFILNVTDRNNFHVITIKWLKDYLDMDDQHALSQASMIDLQIGPKNLNVPTGYLYFDFSLFSQDINKQIYKNKLDKLINKE